MAGFIRQILPIGLFAATFCAVEIVKAHDSYESLLYDKKKFTEAVPGKPHFVLFFAPWCGHCKRLMPTWEDLYSKYNSLGDASPVIVARVDCTQESALCSTQEVTGYPTMKLFTPDNADGVKYRGQRDLGSLEGWLKEQLGADGQHDAKPAVPSPTKGTVMALTSDNYHETVKTGLHFIKFYAPWCSHCQWLAPIWEELAKTLEYDEKVTIAKVDCTVSSELCESANVKGYPTLLWIKDGQVVDMFHGERTLEMLKAFVDEMKEKYLSSGAAAVASAGLGDEMVLKSMPSPAPTLDSVVVDLTKDNFQNAISSGISFVKFYAPWCGHCKRLAPTWDELAKKFLGQGNVRICKVDCTQEQNRQLCEEQQVEGYPTLYLFKDGKKVREYEDKRELDSLFHAVMQLLKDEL